MLRIRFHGRGGQGMKTASRILGSAAFHAGFVVQDAPVYGAERRGAPMAAFTRIAHAPILERGALVQADLVVVADDTLFTDPAAQPLAGGAAQCTLLVNSTRDEAALRRTTSHDGRLLVADFTALALDLTQTLASLSTALGIAAAHIVGLALEDSLAGLNEELDDAQFSPAQYRANLQSDGHVWHGSCPLRGQKHTGTRVEATPSAGCCDHEKRPGSHSMPRACWGYHVPRAQPARDHAIEHGGA